MRSFRKAFRTLLKSRNKRSGFLNKQIILSEKVDISSTNEYEYMNRKNKIEIEDIKEVLSENIVKSVELVEYLNLKTFKLNGNNSEQFDCTPKTNDLLKVTNNNTPNSSNSILVSSETSIDSERNSVIDTPQTNSSDLNEENLRILNREKSINEKDNDLDNLEILYKEVRESLRTNLPYYAYSQYLGLCKLLFNVLDKRIGKDVLLEMNLLLNLKNNNQSETFSNGNSNSHSISSPSSFHYSFRNLKFNTSRTNNNNNSNNNNNLNGNNADNIQSSKSKVLLELVYLNRNGIPIKNNNTNSSTGVSRRWRHHNNHKTSESTNQLNSSYKKGKLFLESFSLLPKRFKDNGTKQNLGENINVPKTNTNTKLFYLEEFPCIIFSYNCSPIYNHKFSCMKNRNMALEFLNFPTEVKCIGLENEARLADFIVKLVTDMHIHRLRFSLYKCSSSYIDLVLALKIRRKYIRSGELISREYEDQLEKDIFLEQKEKTMQSDLLRSEWNSLGDSNLGMWWAMGSDSEFLILCDYIVNSNALNIISIVNESDLHLHWTPFVTSSECLAYIGLYNQLVRHSSNMPWPIGLCQCSLYCVAIDVYRPCENLEPCIIITAVSLPDKADSVCGIKAKETHFNASKLDILSLCFVIQAVPNSPSQTRISFLSKSIIPIPNFVPKAVPSFIAKQIGKSFFNNIINIIEKFNTTPFYQRIKSDEEFYGFVRMRLNITDESRQECKNDPSPIRKKILNEIKQREEMEEVIHENENKNPIVVKEQHIDPTKSSFIIEEDTTKASLKYGSDVVKTMNNMFPNF